jgi:hypothetical protein
VLKDPYAHATVQLRAWHNATNDDHTPLLLCAKEASFLKPEYKTSPMGLQAKKCNKITL